MTRNPFPGHDPTPFPMDIKEENMSEIKTSQDGVLTLKPDALHIDIPKLLDVAGLADTSENRRLAAKVASALCHQQNPDLILVLEGRV